jgi:Leucine-rich repeat (LRR) protein
MLKPKELNISKEFWYPCSQGNWDRSTDFGYETDFRYDEKESLKTMYEKTNGQNWTNNAGWMYETVEHCKWHGISCDVDGFVTSIDLKDNNLVGRFPLYTRNEYFDEGPIFSNQWRYSKYGLANLYKLKILDLADNTLTGAIEYRPLYNLRVLTHFDVSGNQFSGEVNALVAPSLAYADFSNNRFTSMHRFEKYKVSPLQTLRYCDVSNNSIEEYATDLLENIPPNIELFFASNNQINGSLPESLNNLQKLRQFNMASNALSGELPGFTESFATLQELDISKQTIGFTGTIPGDVWRSLSLKMLNLAGNRLKGAIPTLVGNLAVLEVFDLSNNHLDSSIPPALGMLEGM